MNPCKVRIMESFVENWPNFASPKETDILDLNSEMETKLESAMIVQLLHTGGHSYDDLFFEWLLVGYELVKVSNCNNFCQCLSD